MVSATSVPVISIVFSSSPIIFTADKVAAPRRRMEPSPTVMIMSLPLVSEEYFEPEIESVEVALKPLIESEPSPSAYSIRWFEPNMSM